MNHFFYTCDYINQFETNLDMEVANLQEVVVASGER
mgnify:CR=1 FL=1